MQRTAVPEDYDPEKRPDSAPSMFSPIGQGFHDPGADQKMREEKQRQLDADTDEFRKTREYTANVHAGPGGEAIGATASSNQDMANWATDPNAANPTMTNAEELAQRRADFYYGGSRDARAQTVADIQAGRQKYGQTFDTLGTDAAAQAAAARGRTGFLSDTAMAGAHNAGWDMRNQAQNIAGVGRQFQDFAASGPGPSAAQAQLAENTSAAMQNQLAMARSGRGMGQSASAMRGAASNVAGLQMTAGNQAAMLRAQEESDWRSKQLQAMGGAGSAYGAAGGLYGAGGQLALGAGQYYTDANMRNRQQNDAAALAYSDQARQAAMGGAQTDLGYRGEERAVNLADLSANQAYQGNVMQYYGINRGVTADKEAQAEAAKTQREAAVIGGASALGGAIVAGSDVRSKKNIRPVDASLAFNPVFGGSELKPVFDDPYPEEPPPKRKARPASDEAQAIAHRALLAISGNANARAAALADQQNDFEVVPQVNVGGTPVLKQDVDYDALDQAQSDIRAKKDIKPAEAARAFDMREGDTRGTPVSLQRPPAEFNRGDVGKSREQLAREAAFDMRTAANPIDPVTGLPADIARPRPAYGPGDVGKSREQLEGQSVSKALKKAPASSYQYKTSQTGAPTGKTFTGPMAQDLAKTPQGRSAVVEGPNGMLGVDTGRLSLLNASAFGEQQGELERLKAEIAALKKRKGGS